MKWLKRILGACGVALLALAAAIGGWAGVNWWRLRADPAAVEFLRPRARPLDANVADGAFHFGPDFYVRHRVFLLGETHGIAIGQQLDLALLRHLSARAGVRHYVGELDPAQAEEFNRYLATGETAHLRRVFRLWFEQHLQWANRDFMEKVVAVRAFNATLPPERRIRFVGLDRVQDLALVADQLAPLLARVPEDGWLEAAELRALLRDDAARAANIKDGPLPVAAAKAWARFPAEAPPGFAPRDWQRLTELVRALAVRHTVGGREAVIAENLRALVARPEMANEKFYGLWGSFHVLQAVVEGEEPMALQVSRSGAELEGAVASLTLLCVDARMMLPSLALPRWLADDTRYTLLPYTLDHAFWASLSGIRDLTSASRGELTLFELDAPDSPFRRPGKLDRVGGVLGLAQSFNVDLTRAGPRGAAQYAILSRSSPACRPLTEADVAAPGN